jgi:hypothetical protein
MKLLIFVLTVAASFGLQAQTPATPAAPTAAAPTTPAPAPENPDKVFVQKHWGQEFGQCFMSQAQYQEFEKKWTRYRILTRARYNILAKSYFANKMPKLKSIEIDKAFQYQALEPMTCPGMTDEERAAGAQKALQASLEDEGYKIEDAEKLFELDDTPKKLEDFLDLFNDPAFISMPYSLQDGYDELYRAEWDRVNSKKDVDYTYTGENGQPKTVKLSKDQLREIDAIARTLWAEVSACDKPDEGHFQMVARVIADRAQACERDALVNRRHCRADPEGNQLPELEQVVAAPAQFPSWEPGKYALVEVTNTAGRKIGKTQKEGVGFKKLVRPNPAIRRELCPTMAPDSAPLSQARLELLQQAYVTALELVRDPQAFRRRWKWPKAARNGIRYYSYGLSFARGVPKNIHAIIDGAASPAHEYDLKKTATSACPVPYLYERR